jgi:hypothetical protein
MLPIPYNLIDLHQLGNPSTAANTRHISQPLTNQLMVSTVTTDHIDFAATQVRTIIHEYHDMVTHIWPMQDSRQDTATITQLKSPISRAGLRQIVRLAKLINECNKTINLYPDAANDHAMTPIHINKKITILLSPAIPISTSEAHKQCLKVICMIGRQASNTLTEKLRDKENESYGKPPKHYHNNLKLSTRLLPRARYQSRVTTLKHPITKTTHNTPQKFIDIITTHYTKEQQRATPD